VGHIVEDEIAVSIGKRDLQIRFDIEAASPCHEFLLSCVVRGIERGHPRIRMRGRERIAGGQAFAPIERLDLLVLIDSENVGRVRGVDAENLRCLIESDRRFVRLSSDTRWSSHTEESQRQKCRVVEAS
jgi:hypothetical protein